MSPPHPSKDDYVRIGLRLVFSHQILITLDNLPQANAIQYQVRKQTILGIKLLIGIALSHIDICNVKF